MAMIYVTTKKQISALIVPIYKKQKHETFFHALPLKTHVLILTCLLCLGDIETEV